MIYVALIEGAALAATALTFAGIIRSLVRQQARERGLLVDQVCHLSGRSWSPPPAAHEPREFPERETFRNVEQLPEWALAE